MKLTQFISKENQHRLSCNKRKRGAEKRMKGCPFDYIFERIVKEVPLKDRWILIDDIKTAAENRLRTFNRRKKGN